MNHDHGNHDRQKLKPYNRKVVYISACLIG